MNNETRNKNFEKEIFTLNLFSIFKNKMVRNFYRKIKMISIFFRIFLVLCKLFLYKKSAFKTILL